MRRAQASGQSSAHTEWRVWVTVLMILAPDQGWFSSGGDFVGIRLQAKRRLQARDECGLLTNGAFLRPAGGGHEACPLVLRATSASGEVFDQAVFDAVGG